MTNSIQVFHALYIETWTVTAKREPLSLSLIIMTYPLRFLLGPTHLSEPFTLFVCLTCLFHFGCSLRFVRSALAFHTWSSEVANTRTHKDA